MKADSQEMKESINKNLDKRGETNILNAHPADVPKFLSVANELDADVSYVLKSNNTYKVTLSRK
jgi:hypothetical protein